MKGFFRTVGRGMEALLNSLGTGLLFGAGAFTITNSYWGNSALLSAALAASIAFLYSLGKTYRA